MASFTGATIIKPARDTFRRGYSGHFSDPDGHPWEVRLDLPAAAGRLRIPRG